MGELGQHKDCVCMMVAKVDGACKFDSDSMRPQDELAVFPRAVSRT